MDTNNTRYGLSLLLLTLFICVDASSNDTLKETSGEPREPRVSGRIVKLYSGSRPEPVVCTNEGFQGDPVNCAVFYRCVKERSGRFSTFRYQCAPGTVYDLDLETCNFPRNTKRSECGGIMKPISSPVSSEYTNEVEGGRNEVPHPISTLAPKFTEKTMRTSTLSSQKYKTPITSTFDYDTNKYNNVISALTTKHPWTSTIMNNNDIKKYLSKNLTTTTPSKIQSGIDKRDICFHDGFSGDFDNCRKFYRCVGNQRGGFMRYEFYCSESTVWDDDLQSCNHPWAVKRSKCGRSLNHNQYQTDSELFTTASSIKELGYGYKTDKTIQQQLQISHGSKVSQTQTQISHNHNVIQNQTQINYGDSANNTIKKLEAKQNQTQISHGSAVSQTQTQIDYGHKGMQTQLQIDHSKNSSQSQTQIHESTTKHTTTSQHSQQGTNNNQCSENGFMGDSNNCKKFYRCVDNGRGSFTKYEYLCGEGTVWDSQIESCNHAWAVKECGGHATESNKEEITTTSTTKFTSAGTTTTTQGYQIITTEAPDDDIDVSYGNQGSSEDTTSSTFTTTSTTEKTYSEGNECIGSGFMGDPNNCKIFYRCVDNGKGFTKHEFKCGEGTLWDPDIEACNHAWAVKKCGGSSSSHKEETTTVKQTTLGVQTTVTLIQTTTQPSTVNDEDDVGYGPPAEKPSSSTMETTTTSQIQSDECVSSGFMGDSKDCKKFYRCVDNGNGGFTKHEFACGEGTVWDPKIDSCNHAWAVENCGGNNNNQLETQVSTNKPTPAPQTTVIDKNTDSSLSEPTSTSSSTSTSATESVIGNDCTNSGFMGDDKDCKKFYRCVDNGDGTYTRYEFTCGEGTVWDSKIEACNHDWAVEKCGGSKEPSSSSISTTSQYPIFNEEDHAMTTQSSETSGPTSSATSNQNGIAPASNECSMNGYFGDKNDCKKFYRCIDDGNDGYYRYEFQCGEGTVWDDSIRACNHAWAVKECGPSNTQQSPTQSSTDNNSQEENQEPIEESTSEVSTSTQATQKPETTKGVCKSEGFYGDSSDCKKFYRCVDDGKGGYTKYDFVCGDGTSWNQEIKTCDHESDDSSCLSSSTSTSPISTSAPQHAETTSSTTTEKSTEDSSNTDFDKTDQCTSEGFFAHSQDCKKFIRCVSSGDNQYTKYEFSCGEGTVWVQQIKACDHDYGHCQSQSLSSSRPQASEDPNTTTSSVENQTPSKENDEYESPDERPQNEASDDECSSEGYYGNSKDCTKFYRCVDNGNGGYTKYDFNCGEGTAWDSNIQTCNHISEVESCSGNNNDKNQTQQTPNDEQSQTTESSSSTTKQTSSTTESAISSKDTCEEEGYFGDSQDCKKFYRCVDNGKGGYTKYDFVCGEGTIWDQDITNCNHPQDVSNPSCTPGESSPSSGSETTISSQSSSSTTESQTSSNCSQDSSSEKPGGGNKNVTCDKAGYYPDPNDCKKFYRCVDWDGDGKRFSVFNFECGEGTIWDPALDTCNHEESVYPPRDCSGSQSQSQSETTTEQSTTSEQTTTEESTTTEQTTTTTEKSSISEQTTTQQSTTSEQTTTQQSTTSEQTTQQQTTSEQTTTQQQQTTSEQTTQQQTTSEQTTTQQSTSSEQTTTQESTTSEQTTTQESTTSEQTTQQITEQTTQESTTSEQSTTTEQTTEGGETTESTTEQLESTTDQSSTDSTTTEEQEMTTEESSSSNGDCPETEDDQYVLVCPTSFKRHPKYCNMFYQCTEDDDTHDVNIATFKCPNETIYDESQTQCVEEKKADKKCKGEMARKQRFKRLSNREAIVVDGEKKSCSNVGYYAFEKSECSPAFLKCEKNKSGKLKGFVNQCPKGYIFWSISKRCEKSATVKDCKRSTNDWTERWNIPIDSKNIAF